MFVLSNFNKIIGQELFFLSSMLKSSVKCLSWLKKKLYGSLYSFGLIFIFFFLSMRSQLNEYRIIIKDIDSIEQYYICSIFICIKHPLHLFLKLIYSEIFFFSILIQNYLKLINLVCSDSFFFRFLYLLFSSFNFSHLFLFSSKINHLLLVFFTHHFFFPNPFCFRLILNKNIYIISIKVLKWGMSSGLKKRKKSISI